MREFIESIVGEISETYYEMFVGISSVCHFKKGEYILEQGKNCNHAWFINNGAVKAYELIDGRERVTLFFLENMFFTNYYCWVTSNPSDVALKAVEDSDVIALEYPKLEELCTKHHIFDNIGRKMAELIFVQVYHLCKLLRNYTTLHFENDTQA